MQAGRTQVVDCAAQQACPVRLDNCLSPLDHGRATIAQGVSAVEGSNFGMCGKGTRIPHLIDNTAWA